MFKLSYGQAAIAAIFGSILIQPETSSAREHVEFMHGALCHPAGSSEAAKISYSSYGIQNNSTTSPALIECGTQLVDDVNNSVGILAYNRNATQQLCCWALVIANQALVTSAQNCTNGSGVAAQPAFFLDYPNTRGNVISMECVIPPKTAAGVSHLVYYTAN
jgi:hypothetical protein